MPRPKVYATLFERLVANTHAPDSDNGCWIWAGCLRNGYGAVTVRMPGRKNPVRRAAHRVMLEEILDMEFPLDEGGHLCYDTRCANPDHLEVQTRLFNLSDRRGYAGSEGCMIPVLFPRRDLLDEAACAAWDSPGIACDPCVIPF